MVLRRFVLSGVVVLIATTAAYRWLGHFGPAFSQTSSEWANFGTYFGGVAGPLLSFLALISVIWTLGLQQKALQAQDETLRLQYDLLKQDEDKKIAEQHIRWLDAIYRDMLDLLQTPLPSAHGQGPTTLWAVLYREVDPSTATEDILKSRLLELHKLLQQYCPAVAMYRDNVSKIWDAQIYQDRGARLLDRIKPFLAVFGNLSAIEFLHMHLRGETERKNPEALHRPTRT